MEDPFCSHEFSEDSLDEDNEMICSICGMNIRIAIMLRIAEIETEEKLRKEN